MQSESVAQIAKALVAAQGNMGKAIKNSTNPHFRSKYADLGNVIDACLPALNNAGIAVIQPTIDCEIGKFVETTLIHSESGEFLSCRVPLVCAKNDMQGYGSAVTYARRYGLMTMTGIAPEDDDGQSASHLTPKNHDEHDKIAKRIMFKMNECASVDELKAVLEESRELISNLPYYIGVKITKHKDMRKQELSPRPPSEVSQ